MRSPEKKSKKNKKLKHKEGGAGVAVASAANADARGGDVDDEQVDLHELSCVPPAFGLRETAEQDAAVCRGWGKGDGEQELWLVRVPRGFVGGALDGVELSLDGKPSSFSVADRRTGSERHFTARASSGAGVAAALPTLLLPARRGEVSGTLTTSATAQLRGQITVAGSVMTGSEVDKLAYVHRRVQPVRGLKQRVLPFGHQNPVVSSADVGKAERKAAKKRVAAAREEAANRIKAREETKREAAAPMAET